MLSKNQPIASYLSNPASRFNDSSLRRTSAQNAKLGQFGTHDTECVFPMQFS